MIHRVTDRSDSVDGSTDRSFEPGGKPPGLYEERGIMSEDRIDSTDRTNGDERRVESVLATQTELLQQLKAISSDLWGGAKGVFGGGSPLTASGKETTEEKASETSVPSTKMDIRGANGRRLSSEEAARMTEELNRQTEELKRMQQMLGGGEGRQLSASQTKAPAAPVVEKNLDIHHLWQQADPTIDWTDALGRERATDGLTGQNRWSFYHRMAEKVLDGDLDAYVEVLKTVNPLGDLAAYADGMVIRTPGAERLECTFQCKETLMAEDSRLYLGAMAVRIARDLLAALPVSEVDVEGVRAGKQVLRVTIRRDQLLKRNPAFLDPVAFIEECEGIIQL